ncbi:MAG TPA: NADH-quinone oxidoreductase subunit L [Candidatus Acidoferrales bacterium]
MILHHLWIIPVLPLLGAALNGLLGKRIPQRTVSWIGNGSVGLALLAVLELAREMAFLPPEKLPWISRPFTWIVAGTFRADFTLYLDQLSLVMLLVVAGVGFLIHIYSVGYMSQEGGYYRFFAYLNLFMFFMLLLVLAGNYLLLYVGWEGVGLCSYLLIGFYFLRKSAADAGKKAFIVNRIGDFGFSLGVLLLFWTFGSVEYDKIFGLVAERPIEQAGFGVMTVIGFLLLTGAIGKSAQLPLYVWLPDAMEGPTPVSALIHAATMVAAGVYMVARSNIIFTHAPKAMAAVAVVGCVTAIYSASIGLVQTDLKRVLAYSTISQLGYMFLACGVGAFAAGIFHLMTHAFFKALLFLAAGSVIHALSGLQDIREMGGIRKRIPTTYWTFLVATLAISGAPLFSGFFSKDEILWQTYSSPYGSKVLWGIAVVATGMTAFYMFRLVFLTFHGTRRFDERKVHVHESPRIMTLPLIALAILSVIGGYVGIPKVLGGGNRFEEYLAPVFAPANRGWLAAAATYSHATELGVMVLALGAAAAGFLIAYVFYLRRPQLAEQVSQNFHGLYRWLLRKYYVDELYDAAIVHPVHWVSDRLFWRAVDVGVVDGAVNGLADQARSAGDRLRRIQSGNTRSYAGWVVVGTTVILTFLILGLQ